MPRTLHPLVLATLVVVSAVAPVVRPAGAAIHRVDCTGATGFATIQDAVDICAAGDTVLVIECVGADYAPFEMIGLDRCHVVGAEAGSDTGADEVGVGSRAQLRPVAVVSGDGSGDPCAYIELSTSCSVSNLEITGCDAEGVYLAEAVDTVVSDNRITDNVGAGIFDADSADSQIAGNVVGRNSADGVHLAGFDTLVTDNLIGLNDGIGIIIDPLQWNPRNIHVSNNSIRTNEAECLFDGGTATRIERNGCDGNCTGGGCVDEIVIGGSAVGADVVGNDCHGGSLVDLSGSTELDENDC